MTTLTVRRFDSRAALDAALAERLGQALAARGASAVMLAGGSTPLPAYRALGTCPPAHDDRLHLLYSDERYVPAEAAASNYHQIRPLTDVLGLRQPGVVIGTLYVGSPAQRAGLQPGDLLLEIDGTAPRSAQDALGRIASASDSD